MNSYSNPEYHRLLKVYAPFLVRNNIQLPSTCFVESNKEYCAEPAFLREACNRFPFITAKIVRLRLIEVKKLLDDEELSRMKVIYLVRDPRGTLSSRKTSFGNNCRFRKDCSDPTHLCDDLNNDLDAFDILDKSYPGITVIFLITK